MGMEPSQSSMAPSCEACYTTLYRNLIPLGISPKRFLNSAGQFSGSSPFWLKKALAQRSRPTPCSPTTGPLPTGLSQ